MILTRRSLILGLLAAPAIIRTAGLLMPIKAPILVEPTLELLPPGIYNAVIMEIEVHDRVSEAIRYAKNKITMHFMLPDGQMISHNIKI